MLPTYVKPLSGGSVFPWLTADRIVATSSTSTLETPSSISTDQSIAQTGSATLTVAGLLTAQSALTVSSAVTVSLLTADRVVTTNSASVLSAPASVTTSQAWSFTSTLTVVDGNFTIVGSASSNRTLKFEVDAQSANADLTISTGAQTVDRTLSVPVLTADATLAVLSETQTFSGAKTFSAVTTVSNATASTTTTNGALVVTGGAGIGGSLTLGNDGSGVSIRAPSFVLRSTAGGVGGNIYMDMGTGSSSHGEFIIRSSNGFNDRMTIDATGNLIVYAGQLQIRTTSTPASAGATGVTGTISWDSDYIYVCVATNTWKRVAIATWP